MLRKSCEGHLGTPLTYDMKRHVYQETFDGHGTIVKLVIDSVLAETGWCIHRMSDSRIFVHICVSFHKNGASVCKSWKPVMWTGVETWPEKCCKIRKNNSEFGKNCNRICIFFQWCVNFTHLGCFLWFEAAIFLKITLPKTLVWVSQQSEMPRWIGSAGRFSAIMRWYEKQELSKWKPHKSLCNLLLQSWNIFSRILIFCRRQKTGRGVFKIGLYAFWRGVYALSEK